MEKGKVFLILECCYFPLFESLFYALLFRLPYHLNTIEHPHLPSASLPFLPGSFMFGDGFDDGKAKEETQCYRGIYPPQGYPGVYLF